MHTLGIMLVRVLSAGASCEDCCSVFSLSCSDLHLPHQRYCWLPLPATLAPGAAKREYQPPKPGERIYKGHVSYRLMRELQLGIMFSIAQAGQVGPRRQGREREREWLVEGGWRCMGQAE
jgi:hypothetical protein